MENNQSKTVYVIEDFTWHYVSMFLDSLKNSKAVQDEEFMRLYNKLCDYVDSKIFTACDGDIVELSVIVGRKIN